MNGIVDLISQPWSWWVAGPAIAMIMLVFFIMGQGFGISSNLQTVCSMLGAGRRIDYFRIDWKSRSWNLFFVFGMILGGTITDLFLSPSSSVHISEITKQELVSLGIDNPGQAVVPGFLSNWESLLTLRGFLMLIVGGFLVGFGTRYAGGCTSGHAINGLSNLQLPSLVAVIGFFIGGLLMTHLLIPQILKL